MRTFIIMNFHRLRLIIFLHIISSCSGDSLRKIEPSERFEFSIRQVENSISPANIEVRLDSLKGLIISEDSLNKLRPDTLGFDYYANSNDELKVVVTRQKNFSDELFQKRWDSLLTINTPFLIKSLKLSNMDSLDIINTVNSYANMKPLVSYSVDCDQVRYYLEEAHRTDQGVRTGKIAASMQSIDRQNQELILSILQCCGSKAIEEAGNEAAKAAFLIVQHAKHEMRVEYFNTFENWAKEGIIRASTLALMIDRMRMHEGESQLFGSQITTNEKGDQVMYRIDDLEKVRLRRDSLNMEPLEDYLLRFNITL